MKRQRKDSVLVVELGDGWSSTVHLMDFYKAYYGPTASFEECRRYFSDGDIAKIEAAIEAKWPEAQALRFRR